jgi:hypothetical protein
MPVYACGFVSIHILPNQGDFAHTLGRQPARLSHNLLDGA